MTKDEIQTLAYKAQIKPMLVDGRWGITNMEVFVDILLKEEREACAVIAETPVSGEQDDITMEAKDRIAAAIRARNNVQQEPQK